jgi:drug/metabolite transporter (DMT)-like permease
MVEEADAPYSHPSHAKNASAVGWMVSGAVGFAAMSSISNLVSDHSAKAFFAVPCDWHLVALVRSAFALVLAIILIRIAGAKLVIFGPPALWLRSIAGSASLLCNFYALAHLPTGDALTISNVYPVWIVILSRIFFGHRMRFSTFVLLSISLLGVVCIAQPKFQSGDYWAPLVALMASFSTAFAMVGLHQLGKLDSRTVVAHFSMTGAVTMLLLSIGVAVTKDESLAKVLGVNSVTVAQWSLLLAVGATGTVGQLCLTKAYATGLPAYVAIAGMTQVVFALLFDFLLNRGVLADVVSGRPFSLWTLVGIPLVLFPAAWLAVLRATFEEQKEAISAALDPTPKDAAIDP